MTISNKNKQTVFLRSHRFICGLLALLAGANVSAESVTRIEHQGVVVEMQLSLAQAEKASPTPEQTKPLQAGDHARFRFKVYDKATQSPLSGAFPAAWAHPRGEAEGAAGTLSDKAQCNKHLETFLGGSLFSRAAVDMNTYHVLALNDDPSITVVDPQFGFGGSKLLTMVPLPGIGYDWVKTSRQDYLYVSVPATGQIVKINPINWAMETLSGAEQWHKPKQLLLQQDQQLLWTAVTLANGKEGVAVIDLASFTVRKVIPTGRGITELLLAQGGQSVWVLNARSRQLSVLSTQSLDVLETLALDDQPTSLAQSSLSQSIYVGHAPSGLIKVFDNQTYQPKENIQGRVGMGPIRFSPNGRWGFVINETENRLSLLDASKNRIVQSSVVESVPHDVSFSDNLAYIRHRDSATVLMVTLDDRGLGQEGKRIPAVDTVGGDRPPGAVATATAAPGIVQAPGANAVLMANYHDQAVYFYKEGMAAPMGQFNNYNRSPRAVMAIDRSLRELHTPGEYETVVQLPSAGLFDVVYFMDTPRIVHCFQVEVAGAEPNNNHNRPDIKPRHTDKTLKMGTRATLNFDLATEHSDAINPLQVVISLASGLWRDKRQLKVAEDGHIALSFTPPTAGVYNINFYAATSDAHAQPMASFTYSVPVPNQLKPAEVAGQGESL